MAWTKKLRAEQVDVAGGGDNVTRYIFNDLQSTTSLSDVVLRQFNIGTLADVKMIRINAEFQRLVQNVAWDIQLFDPLNPGTFIRIKNSSLDSEIGRYYQNIFFDQTNDVFIRDTLTQNYNIKFNITASDTVSFDPTVDYDVRVVMRSLVAGGTAISRGFLIEIYK